MARRARAWIARVATKDGWAGTKHHGWIVYTNLTYITALGLLFWGNGLILATK
jgi:hypothetical protein